jgi:hypothetical protein
MRKLLLISALLLASASAQAEPNLGPVLAANDTPAPVADTAAPAPAANTAQPQAPVTQPDQSKPQASDSAKPHASKAHAQVRRHESDEAKARRIAAKYGVYW